MQLLYNNECKPYSVSDNARKEEFDEVARHCQSYKDREELIKVVFEHKNYVEKVRHAELIVRVPHILAHYRSYPEKLEEVKAVFAPLFKYYETTLVDLAKDYPRRESKVKVEKLNEKIGLYKKLKSNEEHEPDMFRPSDSKYLPDNESKVVIHSNYPQLTVKAIYRELSHRSESSHIMVEFAKLDDVEIRDRIEDALDGSMKPWLIIDCSNKSIAEVLNMRDILQKSKNQKIVFVCQSGGSGDGTVIFHGWTHLSEATQKTLFERSIKFQGTDLKLKKVLPLNSDALVDVPLEKLMEGKLVIGENVVETIENTVVRSFTASNQTSQLNFSNVIKQAELTPVIVLSNEPGMGKSTEWRLMARRIKDCNPGNWVCFIDLKQHIESFKRNDGEAFENKKEIANYICSTILKIKGFDAKVFLQLFEDERVVFLMDAFDEISPNYKDCTLKLIKAVIEKSKNQMWISTRPHLRNELKGQLGQGVVYELLPFTKSDRDRFLRKRLENTCFQGEDLEEAMKKIQSLSLYYLFNPLLLRMVAEVFEERKDFISANHLNIFSLYKAFRDKTMTTYIKEKGDVAYQEHLRHSFKPIGIFQHFQKVALLKICNVRGGEKTIEALFSNLPSVSDEELTRVGFVTLEPLNKIEFVHRTFAEYFVADYIFEKIFLSEAVDEAYLQIVKTIFDEIWSGDYNGDDGMVTKFVNNAITQKFDSWRIESEGLEEKIKHKFKRFAEELDLKEDTLKWIKVQTLCLFFVEKKKTFYKLILTVEFNTVFSKKWEIVGHFAEFCSPEEFDEIISFAIEYQDQKEVKEWLSTKSLCTRAVLTRAMHNITFKDMFNHILRSQQIQEILTDKGWKEIFSCDDVDGKDFFVVVADTRHFLIFLKWVENHLSHSDLIYFLKNSGGLNHVGYFVNFSGYEEVKECCNWLRDKLSRSEFRDCIILPSLSGTMFGIQYNVRVTHFEDFFADNEKRSAFLLKEDKKGWTTFHYEFATWVQKNSFGLVIDTYERWCGKDAMKKLLMKKIAYFHEIETNILHFAVINKSSEHCNLKLLWNYMSNLLDKESMKRLLIEENEKGESFIPALKSRLLMISSDWSPERRGAFVEDTMKFHGSFIKINYNEHEIITFGFTNDVVDFNK